MTVLTRSTAWLLFCVLFTAGSAAQETEETTPEETKKKYRFSLTFGAAAGNFGIDAEKFNDVYSRRSISKNYFAGIGTNAFYFIAKYREFYAYGQSTVGNIDAVGKTEWRQKHFIGGIRAMSVDGTLYADFLYVVTRAKEEITTAGDIPVDRLTLGYETENKGIGFGLGVTLKIIGPIGVFAEGEYSVMMKKGRNALGRVNPELGGLCGLAGINFSL